MTLSQLVAALAFLLAVPGCIALAYAGSWSGFYPHEAIPIVFGGLFATVLVGLFLVLPVLKRHLE